MDDQTAKNIETAIAQAVLAPETTPSSNAQIIIDDYIKNTTTLEALAVKRIDETIERLKDLKASIQTKCRKNLDEITDLVRLVDDGFRDIKLIEQKGAKIEDSVLTP